MGTHTSAEQVINVVPEYSGVKIVVECAEDACETQEISLTAAEWLALVRQGYAALERGGQ